MTKLIVGLGNPGKEYAKTRHNVGFWCVEHALKSQGVTDTKEKWNSVVAESIVHGEKVYWLRPQTYMNLSGNAVQAAIRFLKLEQLEQNLIVIYDDMDLPSGAIRLREKGGSGGHNGIKSIIANVGSEVFPRIRIGIGRPPFDVTVTDYVLTRFGKPEVTAVGDAVESAASAAIAACTEPFIQVMNQFNSRA